MELTEIFSQLHQIITQVNMQEFNKHWKKFSDTIESYLIRECAKGDINVSSINNEIASNIKRWQNPRNIEGLWLDNLKNKDLDKYHQFMDSFSSFSIHKVSYERPSMTKYYIYIVLIAIISIISVSAMDVSGWKVIFFPILITMLGAGFLIPQGQSKRADAEKDVVKKYMNQIEQLHNTLLNILN